MTTHTLGSLLRQREVERKISFSHGHSSTGLVALVRANMNTPARLKVYHGLYLFTPHLEHQTSKSMVNVHKVDYLNSACACNHI